MGWIHGSENSYSLGFGSDPEPRSQDPELLAQEKQWKDAVDNEVNLEPTQVFHPRYKGCKIAWVRWNGLEDSSTSNNGHFNNYQQFVFPSSVKCEQIL